MDKIRGTYWNFVLHETDEALHSGHWKESDFLSRLVLPDDGGNNGLRRPRYVCGKIEECPDTGRYHFQGFGAFNRCVRGSKAKACFGGSRCSLRVVDEQGDVQACIQYTRKTRTGISEWREFGELGGVGQGKRSDLKRVSEMVRENRSIRDVAMAEPTSWIKYHQGIRSLHNLFQKPAERPGIRVLVLYGVAGSGKSRSAYRLLPDAYWVPKSGNGSTYMFGYAGERDIILDDFTGDIPYGMLLRMLDRYPLSINCQGTNSPFRGERFIITSNFHPSEWYRYDDSNNRMNYAAVLRRLNYVFKVDNYTNNDPSDYPLSSDMKDFIEDFLCFDVEVCGTICLD